MISDLRASALVTPCEFYQYHSRPCMYLVVAEFAPAHKGIKQVSVESSSDGKD